MCIYLIYNVTLYGTLYNWHDFIFSAILCSSENWFIFCLWQRIRIAWAAAITIGCVTCMPWELTSFHLFFNDLQPFTCIVFQTNISHDKNLILDRKLPKVWYKVKQETESGMQEYCEWQWITLQIIVFGESLGHILV